MTSSSSHTHRRRTVMIAAAALVVALGVAAVVLFTSSDAGPRKQASALLGRHFPTAKDMDLTKQLRHLPGDYAGAPAVVLVTPSKGSQPDADRWIAYLRARPNVRFCEVPLLTTLAARMMQGFINGQMHAGLPNDMWPRVIPLYKDGARVKTFFGAYSDKEAWVVVLDGAGVVRWFRAAGFSARAAGEAVDTCAGLPSD